MAERGERYLKHDLAERLLHWVMAVTVIMLILTGLYIRFPGILPFDGMNSARSIHFISMYVLVFTTIAHIYHTFKLEFKNEIFCPSDFKGLIEIIKYYTFLSDELPRFEKYNAIQKLSYHGVWILIIIQAVTGFAMYWPDKLMWLTSNLGGVMALRILHNFVSYVFICFIMVHVYMVFLAGVKTVTAMITGYHYREPEQ